MLIDKYPYSAMMQMIRKGEGNATPAWALAKALGIPDTRTLRLYIENLRQEVCICSSSNGYYFPKDKEEAQQWKNHMLGVMGKYAALAKSADKYLEV